MIRRGYRASPLHLLAHVLLFAAVAWVLLRLADVRGAMHVFVWLGAALVLHDFVLLPLYTVLDRLAVGVSRRAAVRAVPLVNHVRVPAVLAGLTLLVFYPLIAGKSDANLQRASGIEPAGYLGRWLAFAAVAFAASALVYAIRVHRLHRRAGAHEDAAAGGADRDARGAAQRR